MVSFVSAFNWFSEKAFFPMWWKAMKKGPTEQPGDGQNMGVTFALSTLATLTQAVTLALLIDVVAQATGDISVATGALTGLVVGLAVASAALGHRLFAGHGIKVWLIEVSNDLINFVLMGLVFSFYY